MRCVYCGHESRVVDSRHVTDGIRRRRECGSCTRRFTTQERAISAELKVIKARGRGVEEFQSKKVLESMSRVCRGRDVARETLENATRRVEAELVDKGASTIRSRDIAILVIHELSRIDPAALRRFSTNYEEFLDEMQEVGSTSKKKSSGSQYLLFEEPK
jgi:transcriptional repressor NrdR